MTAKPKLTKANKRLTRMMFCKVCDQWRSHLWIGQQEYPGRVGLDLYNCTTCRATQSEDVR